MQLQIALLQGRELLREGQVGAPEFTAELLLRHAVRCERVYLYSHPEYELTELQWLHYGRYLHERLTGKPTQYITRTQEFWGRDFHVEPGVLIPRPETEHVVEQALALLRAGWWWGGSPEPRGASRPRSGPACDVGQPGNVGQASACGGLQPAPTGDSHRSLTVAAPFGVVAAPFRILDIGTGSGILAATLGLETGAQTFATDISSDALRIASGNVRALEAQCRFVRCDLGSAFADSSFDLIVSNPPYIESAEIPALQREVRDWEPREALDGGAGGLEIYARLIPEAARLLRPGGSLVLEIGSGQGKSVPALFDGQWQPPAVVNDLAGLARVVIVQKAQ